MTRRNYVGDANRIGTALAAFEASRGPLPGLIDPAFRECFVEQIIDSESRVRYTQWLISRGVDPTSGDPRTEGFDPLKAAILAQVNGDYDEAVWLVFLFVHFGKHRSAGWRYIRDIYGRLGDGFRWDWQSVSTDPIAFRFWLDENQKALRAQPGPHGFGNHRKYESLNAWEETGTGAAVQSYVEWITESGSNHAAHFAPFAAQSPEEGFDGLFRSMARVRRFGRIARFDYLTMLMKLELLNVRPPHTYIVNSTGPLAGGRLLLTGDASTGTPRQLQEELSALGDSIGVTPDVLEDAICNWQKSPERYIRFSG